MIGRYESCKVMRSVTTQVLYFLLILAKIGRNESCSRALGCKVSQSNDNIIYFGLMLSYPDPLGRKALASVFDDGHDIAPAAYLAVEQINNRSDLLSDYQVELLPLGGGCDVPERTVIGINNLACSCEPVVGIIGPSCGASAELVGEVTGRDRFSMVTIHYGEQNMLGKREMFPYAFGVLGSNFITIQAFTKLMIRSNWSQIILLHPENNPELSEISTGIEKNIKDTPGFDIAFTSSIYDSFVPLQDIKQSFARVIIVLLSAEVTLRTLCLAFHEGMIFPKYQWVLKERFHNEFTEIKISYKGILYFCTEEDISTILYGSINFVWSLGSDFRNKTIDDSLVTMEYEEGYEKKRNLYVKVSSMPVEWARCIYDAVWSLAFALNSSLGEINMNLTQIVPGSKAVAQAIANHMSEINFQGVSGRIDFDNETGFNTARRINIYQFGVAKSTTLIGFYALAKELVILNNTTPQFIKATFDEKQVKVSIAVAIPFLIITVAILLFAVPIQVINIIYRKHSAIKATSPNLNHLIFVGCYLTVIGTVLHIVEEIWPHIHTPLNSRASLCYNIADQWFITIGLSMILGTTCLKTWRLYHIHVSSERVLRLNPKAMTDPVLGVAVGALVLVDLLICLLWIILDPPRSVFEKTPQKLQDSDLPIIVTTVTCQSKWSAYWISLRFAYDCVLVGCSTVLAKYTKIKKKEFQTKNIIILAYLFAITFGLGIPTYIVVIIIGVDVSIRFSIRCIIIDTIMYVCLFALFLPSVVPLIREKVIKQKYLI